MEAKFLGNAPCGHYKFKLPKAIRTESDIGVKVFFFKALLLTGDFSQTGKKARHVWVSKEELGDYLQPKYLAQVRRFLLDVWWTQLPVDLHISQVLGPQEQCSRLLTGTVKRQTKFWELNVFVIVLDFDLSLGDNWLCYIASKSIMLQWLTDLLSREESTEEMNWPKFQFWECFWAHEKPSCIASQLFPTFFFPFHLIRRTHLLSPPPCRRFYI